MENLHPIAVHFPIALLVLYSLMEIVSLFTRVRNNKVVRYIKLFLLLTGRLGLQASLSTGEAAADAGNGVKGILERHETFAGLSNTLYGIVTIGYLIERFINDRSHTNRGQKLTQNIIYTLIMKLFIFYKKIGLVYILAVAGFIALTITGGLGGAMVYGPDADPMVKVILQYLPQ